jgi:Lon protease-like protein
MHALDDVPVFPLPGLVALPGNELGFHFFEPRYRMLAKDLLASEKRLMVLAMSKETGDASGPAPGIHTIASIGQAIGEEANEDGTYDVLFQVEARVRIVSELPSEGLPYRRVRCDVLPDVEPDAATARGLNTTLRTWAREFGALERELGAKQPPIDLDCTLGTLADRLADRYLRSNVSLRQRVLELANVEERSEFVSLALGELLGTIRKARGVSLN